MPPSPGGELILWLVSDEPPVCGEEREEELVLWLVSGEPPFPD